ncbi:MAG: phosphatidylserine/phosphatidylglycerophosphate/cardiolipin synthase family protein, partial [Acidobacteria bacterium]
MPDGRGSFFDVLDRAAARGLDVRVIFWREPHLSELEPGSTHFAGTAEERDWLRKRDGRWLARWDRHPNTYCHHQKSWIVDAGGPDEVSFVGGINLVRPSLLASAGHGPVKGSQDHDVYLEVQGPATTDVHHNFVQRWNEASEREQKDGAWPEPAKVTDLAFPTATSPEAGKVPVQITRTVMEGLYQNEAATPGGKPFSIAKGDKSSLEQYLTAIESAREAIYIEDQAIGSSSIVDALEAALCRGVDVVFLVPGHAHPAFVEARRDPRAASFFEKL